MMNQKTYLEEDIDFIKPSDFQSLQLRMTLIDNKADTKAGDQIYVNFLELLDNKVQLETPSNFFPKNQNFSLQIEAISQSGQKQKIKLKAKVQKTSRLSDGTDHVTLAFLEFDPIAWSGIKTIFQDRQQEIDTFLAVAKGL